MLRRLEEIVGARAVERKEARQAAGEEQKKVMPPPTWFQVRDPVVGAGAMHACQPIDRVLEWAATRRGGRQLEAYAPPSADWACSRWGYCETRPKEGE